MCIRLSGQCSSHFCLDSRRNCAQDCFEQERSGDGGRCWWSESDYGRFWHCSWYSRLHSTVLVKTVGLTDFTATFQKLKILFCSHLFQAFVKLMCLYNQRVSSLFHWSSFILLWIIEKMWLSISSEQVKAVEEKNKGTVQFQNFVLAKSCKNHIQSTRKNWYNSDPDQSYVLSRK